jgi:outer membrane beta-barrel protein
MSILKHFFVVLLGLTLVSPFASAAPKGPGIDAIKQFRQGKPKLPVVQNRFFVKANRFELSPMFGYVPNNPFAQRFVGGIGFTYHFTENIAAQGMFTYSPDLGVQDLKGLTKTLLNIARTGSGGETFQQPLDKVTLSFSANVVWSPLYGKLNLIGETVVNFDFYFVAGFGLNVRTLYAATHEGVDEAGQIVIGLDNRGAKPSPGPVVGTGMNFFLNQTMTFKLDARFNFYVGDKPQYQSGPCDRDECQGKRLYNNFILGTGVSFFFPKMKRRSYIY